MNRRQFLQAGLSTGALTCVGVSAPAVAAFIGSAAGIATAPVPIPGTTDVQLTVTSTGRSTQLGPFTRTETVA